jgi:hypothetical protein
MGDVVELPLRASRQRPLRWPAGTSPHRMLATSRCSNTLEWGPRAWEAERTTCLHAARSARRSEYLEADLCIIRGRNSTGGELNQYGSTVFGQRLRSPGKPHERNWPGW